MSPRSSPSRLLSTNESAFPVTPAKTREASKQTVTPGSNDTTPTPTIRQRRGRKPHLPDGTYRPLSVFTKSLLVPFNLDTDKAFDVLKSESPDRIEEAKNALTPETESQKKKEKSKFLERQHISPSKHKESMGTSEATGDLGMDLITALQITSPEKDATSQITADFSTLCELPIPEPSQHPFFAPDSSAVITDAPLLFTSTSADEIRLLAHKSTNNSRRSSSNKFGRDSVERKKSFWGLEFRTPSSARSRNAFRTSEESPLGFAAPTPSTSTTLGSVKSTSPLVMELVTSKDNGTSTNASNSVRKLSDLFRKKDSMDRIAATPNWSPRNSQESPKLERQDQERYLRVTTNTPTFDYNPSSIDRRHPKTGRGWFSRNLKCTSCSDTCCTVCHRVCCAYRAAVLACEIHREGSPSRSRATYIIQEITKLFPYGREVPTFLQCTAGIEGDQAGCGKMVCPDCCSICPDQFCADTLCKKCKPAMWEQCDWHKDSIMSFCCTAP